MHVVLPVKFEPNLYENIIYKIGLSLNPFKCMFPNMFLDASQTEIYLFYKLFSEYLGSLII